MIRPGWLGTESCAGFGEPGASTHAGRILVQHVQPAGVGAADVHQGFEEPPQQLLQIARLQLDAEQLVEGLRFRLADLIIGVVERQDDAEVKLLAHPLKIGVLVRNQRFERRRQQLVVLLQRFQNRAGRQIQLGQAAAVVFHLLDEFERRLAAAPECARPRPGVIAASAERCLGSNPSVRRRLEELALDFFGVRLQQHRQPLQMHAKLVA